MKKILLLLAGLFFAGLLFPDNQVRFDFEQTDLSNWNQIPSGRWGVDPVNPLAGNFSLKHLFDNTVSAVDTIYTSFPIWNIGQGQVTWRFLLRHAYSPSSSNCWAVFIMADQDFPSGTMGSGYAVGVNLTGNDDLVKLWRIDRGVPVAILQTSVNWQSDIGTDGIAAIEVLRSANGEFVLRISTTPDFDNLIDRGNCADQTYTNPTYFGIVYRYSSAQDRKLWVDDIAICYMPENRNDKTTAVFSNHIASRIPISSVALRPEQAVEMMRFSIADLGSGDGLPTRVRRVAFRNAHPEIVRLTEVIAGCRIRCGDVHIPIEGVSITDNRIVLLTDTLSMQIPDGDTLEYALEVYIRAGGVPDGLMFRLKIDTVNHGFLAGLSGSGFTDRFQNTVLSDTAVIHVVASCLRFGELPLHPIVGKPFALSVVACDSVGNADLDWTGRVMLRQVGGSGALRALSGLEHVAINGVARWYDLEYSRSDTLRLEALSGNQLSSTDIMPVFVGYDTSSIALPSQTGLPDRQISSLSDEPSGAVPAIRFTLKDAGGDSAPTYLKSLLLYRSEVPDAVALNRLIGGVLVRVGDELVATSHVELKASTLKLIFPYDAITIPDGQSVDMEISVFLRSSGLEDNAPIALRIDADNPLFETYPGGSSFMSRFPNGIPSALLTVSVEATELRFVSLPERVGVAIPFQINAIAVDANGNIDTDYGGEIRFGLISGNGSFVVNNGFPVIMEAGGAHPVATYSLSGTFAFLAAAQGVKHALSREIFCGDSDGTIVPLEQPVSEVVFSGNNCDEQSALEAIRFRIKDGGATDGLPLKLSRIELALFNPDKLPRLLRIIGNAFFRVGPRVVEPLRVDADGDNLLFEFAEGDITISDGDSVDVSLKLCLNGKALADGFSFRFYMPARNVGCDSYSDGTAFSNRFVSEVYGLLCRVEVVGNRICFQQLPYVLLPDEPFSISAAVCDSYGNIDYDASGSMQLSCVDEYPECQIPAPLSQINNGAVVWSNVSKSKPGPIRFRVGSDAGARLLTPVQYCGYREVFGLKQGFERHRPSWDGIDDWSITDIDPISGTGMLAHTANPDNGYSCFSVPVGCSSEGVAAEWGFSVRWEGWRPSGSNRFNFLLAYSGSNSGFADSSGYAVGVLPDVSGCRLALWYFNQEKEKPLILSDYRFATEGELSVRVTLSPEGVFSLWLQDDSSSAFMPAGSAGVAAFPIERFGFRFVYSPTRAGKLWVDDIGLRVVDYPPVITAVTPLGRSSVRVSFSKMFDRRIAADISCYRIETAEGETVPIRAAYPIASGSNSVLLAVETPLQNGRYRLTISRIADETGRAVKQSVWFGVGEGQALGSLVINEVMVRPSSDAVLPGYEYLELLNASSDTVYTAGWYIRICGKKFDFPVDTVPPQGYLLLGTKAAMAALAGYGHTLALSSFPALPDTRGTLALFNGNGLPVSFVDYRKDWLSPEKGVSLERIDVTNLGEGRANWKPSTDPKGGTPGAPNSVAQSNPDICSPRLLAVSVPSDTTVCLLFNEPLDSLSATLENSYRFERIYPGIAFVRLTGDMRNMAEVNLANPIRKGETYRLTLSDIADLAGNTMHELTVKVGIPQQPSPGDLVINEVLFDPYPGGVDFVEVYSLADYCIDLKSVTLARRNVQTLELENLQPFSDTSRLIFPEEYVVAAENPEGVTRFYRCERPEAFVWSHLPPLNADEGEILLLNDRDEIIDRFHYTSSMHSPIIASAKGVSLERINPRLPSSQRSSWTSAAQQAGFATPTYVNSQFRDAKQIDDAVILEPATISPDGDGVDDYLLIRYKFAEPGYRATVNIYNSNGILVNRIANSLTLGTEGVLKWDGDNFNHRSVLPGIYIVYIEYTDLRGCSGRVKKACVVARR